MIATSFVAAMSVGLQVAHLQNGLTVIVEPGKEKLAAIRFCARFDTNDPIELGGGEVLAIALMRETDPLEVVNLRKMAWAAGGDLVASFQGGLLSIEATVPQDRLNTSLSLISRLIRRAEFSDGVAVLAYESYWKQLSNSNSDPIGYMSRYYSVGERCGPVELNSVSGAQLSALKAKLVRPERSVLVVTGTTDADSSTESASKAFGAWNAGTQKGAKKLMPASQRSGPLYEPTASGFVDGPAPASPDFPAWVIAVNAIGRGKSCTLYQALRKDEGLAYRWTTQIVSAPTGSRAIFTTGFLAASEQLIEVFKGAITDVSRLTDDRLARAKAIALADYASQPRPSRTSVAPFEVGHSTPQDRAFWLSWWELVGQGAKNDANFSQKLESATNDEVRAAWKNALKTVRVRGWRNV
ncbi:MAG: insulinase family protein [Fimbriimonadales bacterium]